MTTVYVIDDDAEFRTAIGRVLKMAGYQVALYESASQLLDHLPSEEEPGCVLLDVKMPDVSGTDVQGHLAARRRCCRWSFSPAMATYRQVSGQ
jgi:FixJ family two-component response regulator